MKEDAAIARRFSADGAGAQPPGPLRRDGLFDRLRAEPLLPEAGAAGAPLTAAIGVMSLLAAFALAGLLLIFAATDRWTNELQSGLTIQVKGMDADDIRSDAAAALSVLQSTDGVLDARLLSEEETERLLEPWLGKGNVGDYLNVPALIEARIDESVRADIQGLEARLKAAAPGAVLDDHRQWRERLTAAARSGQALALGAFALIMGAAAAIAAFAARAGLAANDDIVAILHLVGATDGFIAGEVQRRFLVLALRGSLMGLFFAAVALTLAALALRSDAAGLFLPDLRLGPWTAAVFLAVPLALCLVTALTARLTVLKTLSKEM